MDPPLGFTLFDGHFSILRLCFIAPFLLTISLHVRHLKALASFIVYYTVTYDVTNHNLCRSGTKSRVMPIAQCVMMCS